VTEYRLSYSYTAHHRYESDMDERISAALSELVAGAGGEMTGDGGGCFVGGGADDLVADQTFYFTAPDQAAADRVVAVLQPLLAFFDERYVPVLNTSELEEA